MSNKTTANTEENAGLNEEHETTLFGDDLAALKTIAVDENEPATESLVDGDVSSLEGLEAPKADMVAVQMNRPTPPCVSRVIDANGSSRTTVILGCSERTEHLGLVISLLDSASENDIVDITIVASLSGEAGTMSQRSLLSAIDRCKGHVITRAGTLNTLGDVALWLSGDTPKLSSMGAVFMRQPVAGYGGDLADYENRLKDLKESLQEFSQFVVERGLVTQEEINEMYQHRGMIALYGEKLRDRVANLKSL